MGVHHLLAENHRQELVEGDVLDQGRVDVPCLLVAYKDDNIDNHKNYNHDEICMHDAFTHFYTPIFHDIRMTTQF